MTKQQRQRKIWREAVKNHGISARIHQKWEDYYKQKLAEPEQPKIKMYTGVLR